MNRSDKSWGWNVFQNLEAICMDLDGFVCKEPGVFIGNQMQTVGESVKKLYSDVMQDFLLSPLADPTQHIAQFLPSKSVDLVETSKTSVVAVKEDSVNSETNKLKEAPVVPETCHKTSSSGINHSEQMTEDGNLINNTSDNTIQENNVVEQFPCEDEKHDDDHSAKISCESSENYLDDMSKHEDILCDASSQNGDSAFENGFIDLNLGTEEKIKVEPLMNLKENCDEEPSAKISCGSSESHVDDMSKNEDILCNASSQCDDSEFEDCWSVSDILDDMSDPEDIICNASAQSDDSECEDGWGEALNIELNLGTEENNEVEPLINLKEYCDDDHSVKMSLDSSQNRLDERIKLEGMLCYTSSQSDASECEDGWGETDIIELNLGTEEKKEVDPSDTTTFEDGWGIPNMIDLYLIPEEKIEVDPLMNLKEKCDDDHSAKICEISENHFEDIFKQERLLSDASSQSDASEFEDEGILNVIDMNLGPEEKIEVEPLMNLKEKCDDDHSDKMSCEISENHLEEIFKQEGTLSDASSQSDASEFEDEDIKNVIDMNLGPEEKIEVEPLINLKEKSDENHSAKMSCEFSENHFEDIFKQEQEGILSDASSQSDASEFEDEGIKNVIDMNLGPEEKIEVEPLLSVALAFEDVDCRITNIIDLNLDTEDKKVEPLMNLEEKKTLLNCSIDEFDCDSSTHQTSELENSVTRNDNKEENGCQTESVDDFSVSSFGLSSCDSNNFSASFTSSSYAISNDTTRTDEADSISGSCTSKHDQLEVSMSCSEIGVPDGSSAVNYEDVKNGIIDMSNGKKLVESSVIAEGGKSFDFPIKAGKSKSYKKMIQDVFMSRKRLAKEYKQLAVLYEDIDKESTEENKLPNIGTTDLPDSEWELL